MINKEILLNAYRLMCTASAMAEIYENNRQICKYVHATSRGHEAIQLATAFNLLPCDFVSPYYRDESLLLGIGFSPYTLMLQLLAKRDDVFTGGKAYYSHPNYKGAGIPTIIHQSSATGMQAIPTTGIAQGLQYLELISSEKLKKGIHGEMPVVVCSIGDASITEGEVSEAFQFASLKKLPIIYLVQDNEWGISVSASESRTSDAYEFIKAYPNISRVKVDGSDFIKSFQCMQKTVAQLREDRGPFLVHASVPLLGHHTSGVRKETYRSPGDLEEHAKSDPLPKLKNQLLAMGFAESDLNEIASIVEEGVREQFEKAVAAPEPDTNLISDNIFADTPVLSEAGNRDGDGKEKIVMVDAALFAIREIMNEYPEAIFFGQDVGRRLGGVFREAATLAAQFGDHRVFNTAIQEAYIIGSTVGLSATGVKPIVEVQFADYLFPGFNQLVTEVAKSCYLTNGKFPVQCVIRVPIGAYGGGGPYHSASIESYLMAIKGIKVAYPSNAADMKGLMKAAFLDPNPVVMLEHKGLYWSKVPGTEEARTPEPAGDYVLPLGIGRIALSASEEKTKQGDSCCIITYGMGIYWSIKAAAKFPGQVEIIDLRTLYPLDEELVYEAVKRHGKCLVLSEEQQNNSFAEALAGRISGECFRFLDAPVQVLGALNLPAVPMNINLEKTMLPNPEKVADKLEYLFKY